MRPLFPVILAYLVMPSTCTAAYAQASPPAVQIVVDHRSAWRIVSLATNEPGMPWAVGELQKNVEAISGAKLPADNQGWEGPAIVVCLRDRLSPEDRAALPSRAEGNDGYAIAGFIKLGVKGWIEAEAKAIAAKEMSIDEKEVREDTDEPDIHVTK